MKIKNLIKWKYGDDSDDIMGAVNEVIEQYGLEIVDLDQDDWSYINDECSVFYKLVEIKKGEN